MQIDKKCYRNVRNVIVFLPSEMGPLKYFLVSSFLLDFISERHPTMACTMYGDIVVMRFNFWDVKFLDQLSLTSHSSHTWSTTLHMRLVQSYWLIYVSYYKKILKKFSMGIVYSKVHERKLMSEVESSLSVNRVHNLATLVPSWRLVPIMFAFI